MRNWDWVGQRHKEDGQPRDGRPAVAGSRFLPSGVVHTFRRYVGPEGTPAARTVGTARGTNGPQISQSLNRDPSY